MVDITDLSPLGPAVVIDGQKIDVPGVSIFGFAYLQVNYASLIEMIRPDSEQMSIPEFIVKAGEQAIAALIAAGCGKPGDLKAEQIACSLGMQQQADLLLAIFKRSLPRGMLPFVETGNNILRQMSGPEEALKQRVKNWQKQQKDSSPPDMMPPSSGNSRLDNSPPMPS